MTEPTPFGLNDLKLAVELVREMRLPFAVVINRDGIGTNQTQEYCQAEGIEIVARIPDDRRIAEAYSNGIMIADALPDIYRQFQGLLTRIDGMRT